MNLTSIIIVTFNNLAKTKKCLDSIRKFTEPSYELIIVDNGSTDDTVKYLKQFTDIKLIVNKENRGFAGGCNQGIRLARGEQILFLNNDTIVSHNWLNNMMKALYISPRVGMVGPLTGSGNPPGVGKVKIFYQNETQYHRFALRNNCHDPSKWKTVTTLYGFCMLVKREVIHQIGLMDERFKIGTMEDNDYCYRTKRAGYTLLLAGDTFVHHERHSSFEENKINHREIFMENRSKFISKWGVDPKQLLQPFCEMIPDGTLVQGNGPKVYYIDQKMRRPIRDRSAFDFWRFQLLDVIQIPDSVLESYPIGEMIDDGHSSILNNILIKPIGENELYLTQDGCKRWIQDEKYISLLGIQLDQAVPLLKKTIDSIKDGPPFPSETSNLANRTLLKCLGRFYLSMNNVLYPINKRSIRKLRLNLNRAIRISCKSLYQYSIDKEIRYNW